MFLGTSGPVRWGALIPYNVAMESLSSLFKEFSYRPRKTAGQNFLVDPKILEGIDQVITCPPGDLLLEVGGGYGALTEKLVGKGAPLVVVEPDHKLFAMLERRFAGRESISFVKADILKLDLTAYRPSEPKPQAEAQGASVPVPEGNRPQEPGRITLAGNIPYYLTSPLITRLLTQYPGLLRKIYLMVQKEVADRLVAVPGTKAYGALTLCAQYYSRVEKKLDVPARCFKPAPKVESAFIEITPKESLPLGAEEEKRFFMVVRSIFQTRRKMLSNSLKSLGKPPELVEAALVKCGIDPQVRGETLGIEKLMELSKALESESR